MPDVNKVIIHGVERTLDWKKDSLDYRDYKYEDPRFALMAPVREPDVVNLTRYESPIKDQGSIGSCTGQGISSLVEYLYWNKTPPQKLIFSPLFIYYNERKLEGDITQDNGAMIRTGIKVVATTGASEEKFWPYSDTYEAMIQEPSPVAYKDAQEHKIASYYRITSLAAMTNCLAQKRPFTCGIMLYESFQSDSVATTGMVPMPSTREQPLGGHCVNCVGYSKPHKLFIMRNSWGCYDDQTEILTDSGWKLFKDLASDEIVATLNQDNHALEYQQISFRHEYDYDGDLWSYSGQGIDLVVTPNHKLYASDRVYKGWSLVEAQDFDYSRRIRMKKNADVWDGKDLEFLVVGNTVVKADDWLEFLGYWISEGNAGAREQYRRERARVRGGYTSVESAHMETYYPVAISQYKPQNIEIMQACLNRLPFQFTKTARGWQAANKALCEELTSLGRLQQDRRLPDYFRHLSRRQVKILFNALMLGDGTQGKGTQECYYTSSPGLADDVQELVLKAGYAADIRVVDRIGRINSRGDGVTRFKEHQISIKRTRVQPCPDIGLYPEKVPYKGKVYCVTVPNHIVYIRRNGKTLWSGNSNWGSKGHFFLPFQYMTNSGLASDMWTIRG